MLEISNTFSFEKYRLYAEKLDTKYPFLTCTVIGRAVSGRPIFAFSLGNRGDSVVITATADGKSNQTCLALCRFLDRICESVMLGGEVSSIRFSSLIKKYGITVIPCLNVDNISPTDAVASFNSFLHIDSENTPEERAFISLCRKRHFRSCLTLRNADEDGIFYLCENCNPSSAMMAKILASSCCRLSENEMPVCPSRRFAKEFSLPAFLIEAESCENFETLFDKLEEALVLMSVM